MTADAPTTSQPWISPEDRTIVRDLARRVAEIAAQPVMAERIAQWKRHNSLQPGRPMILIFPEGSWSELLNDSHLSCSGKDARRIEWMLRQRIYSYEHFVDDTVVTADWEVGPVLRNTGWGVEAHWKPATEHRGARGFDPVIHEPADLKKLRYPEITYDPDTTAAHHERMAELLGDVLNVKRVGVKHISFHLMARYSELRGLEQVMLDMYEEPAMLHDAMAFFAEGGRRMVQRYVELGLLGLNNDNTYHSSGGVGWTDELPQKDFAGTVRLQDMWGSAEAQELAQVSPAMHEEFSLRYERELLAPFGLTGYGCCEPLDQKLDDVLTMPNIRRISISPFSDVAVCAEKLGNRAIFSWKPHPSHLVGQFDERRIRQYIAHTLDVAQGCTLEMVLKDTHTCEHHPERFDRWTRIARELVDQRA